jgi:2-oxoglutarate dehydrogenase E1 component
MREKDSPPINFSNQSFVLEQLKVYFDNPALLDSDWVAFFKGMEFSANSASPLNPSSASSQEDEVYKKYGHLIAKANPMEESPKGAEGIDFKDSSLKNIYCGSTSYECYNIENRELEKWFHEEVQKEKAPISSKEYEMILTEIWKAKYLEEFLQKKFLGAKRFSLEGGESFMPMLNEIFTLAADASYETGIIGMAHRGRLNVLCNLLKKPYAQLFKEFNTKLMPESLFGLGDVKYHKGYRSTYSGFSGKKIELHLASNPSHLESVDPVAVGFARGLKGKVFPLMVHGDASVAGQGVVYETLQCSKLKGYAVGGTLHIVINNQVGFTAVPEESRSTRYCTDIAKAFGAPVIHVSADDPVACIRAARLAFEVKNRFSTDVFIDLNCCRIYGHNEADEPRFTNPLLYQKIERRENVYEKVKKESGLSPEWISSMENGFKEKLENELEEANRPYVSKDPVMPLRSQFTGKSAISIELLKRYVEKISDIPKDFKAHPKIEKLFSERREKILAHPDHCNIDWGAAEALAYASLVDQKIPVRISGQDSKRGTFSHRHAVIFDQTKEMSYIPLEHISSEQASFEVYNSPLSEYAVMGFEFGYSLADPKALVIWEAQFGDFANGAQIIIDQYLAGSETKWGVHSGLVLFLPHGHEGMGPEHTSCRLERFLELSGQNNWRVVYPTTPSQFFHILREQALDSEKRPLIIPTPKSMLRLSDSFSSLDVLAKSEFMPVIDDTLEYEKVEKIVFCTGKFYYELKKARGDKPIALVRLEQIYPFPAFEVEKIVSNYKNVQTIVWAQEEPKNQGAFGYVKEAISEKIQITYVGRECIPVPDTGIAALFHKNQEEIIKEALK